MSAEMRATARPSCALCGARADVHCQADAAFLCAPCDAEVFGANLLASRHRRTRIPPSNDARVSARRMGLEDAGAARLRPAAASDVRARCGSTLQVWARRMGLDAGAACLRAAAAGRTVWVDFAAVAPRIPLRVAMAAALWREVAAHAHAAGHEPAGCALQRLVACSHVPASLLVEAAASIGRTRQVTRTNTQGDSVECSIVSPHNTQQELCLFV